MTLAPGYTEYDDYQKVKQESEEKFEKLMD
jgi:hypothetical protein